MRFLLLALLLASAAGNTATSTQEAAERLVSQEITPAVTIAVVRGGELIDSVAAGEASPGVPMEATNPLRQASVTKTFVAATLLRLAAEHDIPLDTAIQELLPAEFVSVLSEGGYETGKISLDQLLTHSAGLQDHTNSPVVEERFFRMPGHEFTALEQVELMVQMEGPLSPPGEAFAYSDTGYVLLGKIIEGLSGKTLHEAVREYMHFDEMGLSATWWEQLESAPASSPTPAIQYMDGWNISKVSPTIDLFGGGGLMSSSVEIALLFHALFDSGDHPGEYEPLRVKMLSLDASPAGSSYARGIQLSTLDGDSYYIHTGYWGTAALYFPEQRIAIAGAVTESEAFPELIALIEQVYRAISD
jgi:D-alanyl-D-alanine carboxypeptidase